MGVFLVDDNNASGDASAVEEVDRQANNALDEATLDKIPADVGLSAAAKKYSMRQYDCTLPLALERGDQVQQKGIVAVSGWGDTVFEAPEFIVGGIEPVGPGLV